MPIERPTFHESWYRVGQLHPRLRSTVQVSRQHFRGLTWHVVQDHTNNAFFRLSEPAYRLIGLLNGTRTVGEAWKICSEQMGDDAPTQGEAIQLLGQLYTSNLLQSELPPDSASLFARYKKRKGREVQSFFANILFARIPILDPDLFLDRTMWLFGWIFSWVGLVVWAALITMGIYAITSVPLWYDKMAESGRNILDPKNLPLLYLGFALIKACHEFGHAISCKRFGRGAGGGEVHVMGIMLLVFTPVPYVDASSSWAFQNKWHRIIVGAAGMWVELAIASLTAVVWANSGDPNIHALSFNILFVASVSTVLFNANPLLRYDGYYILSDLLEIPNLAQRSKDYIYYLVKRYVWGLKQARDPSHSLGEGIWFFCYAVASFLMRVSVSFGILLFVADKLFILGVILALGALVAWVLTPFFKFLHYLTTSPELLRVRGRALSTSALGFAWLVVIFGVLPYPDRAKAQGVIEPLELKELFAKADGLTLPATEAIGRLHESGTPLVERGAVLVSASNTELRSELQATNADKRRFSTLWSQALAQGDTAKATIYRGQIDSLEKQAEHIQQEISDLVITAPIAGAFVAPDLDQKQGAYLKRGEKVGLIANLAMSNMTIRATAPQEIAGLVNDADHPTVQFRILGRPDDLYRGTLRKKFPAGQNNLPSASLGYAAGGDMAVSQEDNKEGTKTNEAFFEVLIDNLRKVDAGRDVPLAANELLPGQRVVVRFDFGKRPILAQLWTSALQLVQRRFQI